MLLGSRFSVRLVSDIYSPGIAGFGGLGWVGSGMDGLRALHAPRLHPKPLPGIAALAHWQGSVELGQVSKRPWIPGVREMPYLPLSDAEVHKKTTYILLLVRVKERGGVA